MAKKKGMKFLTEKERKANKAKKFILAFAAFLLAFAVISVTYIFKAYHLTLDDFKKPEESLSETTETNFHGEVNLEGKANFIIAGTDDEGKNIYYIFAVNADLDDREIKVLPVNPSRKATVDGEEDTILNHFKRDSQRGLIAAVNNAVGFTADRYAISNEAQFKGAINALGGAQIKIDKRIDYKSKSFKLSLMPGEQSMKGETLLKYIRYVGMKVGINAQAQLICDIISQFITDTYVSSARGYFSEIINNIDSDITIVDFSKSEKLLKAMADEDSKMQYKPVTTAEELLG